MFCSGDDNQHLPADANIYPVISEPIQVNEDTVEIPFRLCHPYVWNLVSSGWSHLDTNLVEWMLSDVQSVSTPSVPGNFLMKAYSSRDRNDALFESITPIP